MGVYLGNAGWVELRRTSVDAILAAVVNAADVDIESNRMGFDRKWGSLLTGDKVSVRSDDGASLRFIQAWQFASIECYLNVDELDGVRLYTNYTDAINGLQENSIPLVVPSSDQAVTIRVDNPLASLLGQITSYELTTRRETIDITPLGDEFRMQYTAGLISGQGQLQCFWEYRDHPCSEPNSDTSDWEWAHYFHNLIIRTELGSAFYGRFILKGRDEMPMGVVPDARSSEQLHYRAMCTVTNAAIQFSPSGAVVSTIDFVTTGQIYLRLTPADEGFALIRESGTGRVLQESDARVRV
jgi:hypothetical protein